MGIVYQFNYTDTSPASLSSKYQRVVIIQEKKGFSSQAKRFPSQDCLNENPGPGTYDCVSSAEVQSPSFSKKGTVGFVPSKAARPPNNPHRSSPGPNVYNLQSKEYNFGPKHETPAPNQYNVSCGRTPKRSSSVVGTSAFLSKTGRYSFCPKDNVPSPCHYEVRDGVILRDTTAIMSPFKSKTQRIPPPVDHHVPGPGAYSPHQTPAPEKKTSLPKGYYLTISAPPLTVPKFPPLPGPWQYYIGSYNGPSKRPMPTAVFASRAKRLPQRSRADMRPGPGIFNPHILPKQSFIYNVSGVWIPL